MMSKDAPAALLTVLRGIRSALKVYGSMAGGGDANAGLVRQIRDMHLRHAAEIGQRLKASEMPAIRVRPGGCVPGGRLPSGGR